MKIRQILSEKPQPGIVSIRPDQTLGDAVALLAERKIGAVMVLRADGGMAGILSERDIVRRLSEDGAGCLSILVENAMTAEVQSCAITDSTDDILRLMTKGRFRHVPVFEHDELVGIISIGDVVKAQMDALKRENEALSEMINSAMA